MTREEAIDVLKAYLMFDKSSQQVAKALDMAIEALQAEAVTLVKPNTAYCENGEWRVKTETSYLIELVRCKDCRFWKNKHLCLVMSRYGSMDTKAEHYCSWGERRKP